jgi:hypothetical protein
MANPYLLDVAQSWFIYSRSPTSGILSNHQVLGSHTDVFLFFNDGSLTRLTWSHPGIRPFGTPAWVQCSKCGRIKAWVIDVKKDKEQQMRHIRLKCGGPKCGLYHDYPKPENLEKHSKGQVNKTDGEWYRESLYGEIPSDPESQFESAQDSE